ncbi:hypothetical protein RLOatenuis_2960 [Rickettsiales bacterium]|nr:hypothetical protein RLOatenuis_2960 [Rickettsiales bacterium]
MYNQIMDKNDKIVIGCAVSSIFLALLFICTVFRGCLLSRSHSNQVNQTENENVPPPLSHSDHPGEYPPSYEQVMAHPESYPLNSLPAYKQVLKNQDAKLQGAQNTRVLGPPLRETDV